MKLWQKKYDVNKEVEKFTVGNDFLLDLKLVCYDCAASIAHAKMLKKIGILNDNELKSMIEGLKEIIRLNKIGKFEIRQEDEDCHTAIENYLVKNFGEAGKKIHTGRSRNDQVLTAIRLYEKEKLKEILGLIEGSSNAISEKIKEYGNVELPGYTHMQKAMPTTIKKWFSAYVEALKDDKKLISSVLEIIDKNPLGSAAGFGLPVIEIDRKMTSELLGFGEVMETMYCQNSRGKFEAMIIDAISQVMMDLNKIATDLIIFSMDEFGFFSLPKELCTGSSIMPQKKNPDVLELLRAKYHVVNGYSMQVKGIYSSLVSGYNRDMQLTKEPLLKSVEICIESLKIALVVFEGLIVNKDKCKKAMTSELYATEEALKLVKKGMPFRDAYKKVGEKFS
jgi:argininosuccinate lyase